MLSDYFQTGSMLVFENWVALTNELRALFSNVKNYLQYLKAPDKMLLATAIVFIVTKRNNLQIVKHK